MSRWWKGVALLAGWLTLGGAAQAQLKQFQYAPSPVGATRMPEPLPCGPLPPQPPLVPGPIPPEATPPVPLDCLTLPAGSSGAFQTEHYTPESAWFASVGTQAFQRQRMGKGAIAVLDPQNLDTGAPPPPGQDLVQRYNDITPQMAFGVRGTVGYLWGNQSLEVTSFYIFQHNKAIENLIPGRIDAFFFNPPLGFEGDNGLWLQADHLRTILSTTLANSELNYHVWNGGINHAELILGVRYLFLREKLDIFTDDDGATFKDARGFPDPVRQAAYVTQTRNQIIAPQIGFEYSTPAPGFCSKWLWLGCTGKVALGPNLINLTNTLTRGDGYSGFNVHQNRVGFGQIYELGAFVDVHLLERLRVRAGYNAIWLAGVAVPNDQVDFNLANPVGGQNTRGSVLFHGPQVELQFLF